MAGRGADENITLASFQKQEQLPCARVMCRIIGCGEADADTVLASFHEQEQLLCAERAFSGSGSARC